MYQIGDILFVLDKSNGLRIFPVKVIKKIVEESLTGSSVAWIVESLNKTEYTVSELLKTYFVFKSIEDLRVVITEDINKYVNKHIDSVKEKASLFNKQHEEISVEHVLEQSPSQIEKEEESYASVMIDGIPRKVKLPK